jgi:hypothetical protein
LPVDAYPQIRRHTTQHGKLMMYIVSLINYIPFHLPVFLYFGT